MKLNKFLVLLSSLILAASMTACSFGNNDDESSNESQNVSDGTSSGEQIEPYDYMANDISSMVNLGEYTGITVTQESAELTEEEFANEIDNLLTSYTYNVEITDRVVADGDTVMADFSGYKDGVQFSGGTAQNQEITATSGTGYIEGFAEAFVGQTPGVEFSFNVTFPQDYGNEELNGQEVTFVCTVHYILGDEIIPTLTDEFVTSNFSGYSNADEFLISFRDTVESQKEYYVKSNMFSELWQTIVENAEVVQYPEGEVERVYNERRSMYEQYASLYQIDYETFLTSYVGLTDDELLEESRNYVKEDLVMYTLIKERNISLTEEDYNDGFDFYADYYSTTKEELIEYYGEETIKITILWEKLMEDLVTVNNVLEG